MRRLSYAEGRDQGSVEQVHGPRDSHRRPWCPGSELAQDGSRWGVLVAHALAFALKRCPNSGGATRGSVDATRAPARRPVAASNGWPHKDRTVAAREDIWL